MLKEEKNGGSRLLSMIFFDLGPLSKLDMCYQRYYAKGVGERIASERNYVRENSIRGIGSH